MSDDSGAIVSHTSIRQAVIAADTSNYTTSVSAVGLDGSIIADERKLLEVRQSDRGLRQSHALFQHLQNLPELIKQVTGKLHERNISICAVSASNRPRPVEGSYMPVFSAGVGFCSAMASALNVPFYTFSHQEGHIAAVCGALAEDSEILSFHLSGGTGEILKVKGGVPVEITGGIKDISYGQLIDRVGVAYGFGFPAGKKMDEIAVKNSGNISYHISRKGNIVIENAVLKQLLAEGCFINLSGTETQCMRACAEGVPPEKLVPELFMMIADSLVHLTKNACEKTGIYNIVYAGGVASSAFLRDVLLNRFSSDKINVRFGESKLSSDNACGIGILGKEAFFKEEKLRNS